MILAPDTITTETRPRLPRNVASSEQTEIRLPLTSQDLPWITDQEVRLSKVQLKVTGREFYVASAISGKNITTAAKQLTEEDSRQMEEDLYTFAEPFLNSHSFKALFTLKNPRTRNPIHYLHTSRGLRLYFMRYNIDDKLPPGQDKLPLILIVAKCKKNCQEMVLNLLT